MNLNENVVDGDPTTVFLIATIDGENSLKARASIDWTIGDRIVSFELWVLFLKPSGQSSLYLPSRLKQDDSLG